MAHALLDIEILGLLRESLERYGREQYAFQSRRERSSCPGGYDRDAWRDYADMGWLAMPLAVADDGFESAPEAIGALMEYAGGALALEPLFASVVMCGRLFGLAGADPQAQACLQLLAGGKTVYALAHAENSSDGMNGEVHTSVRDGLLNGRKLIVLHGDSADVLIVTARDVNGKLGLFLVDANQPQLERECFQLVDGRGAANLVFKNARGVQFAASSNAQRLLASAMDDARLALCAEAYGASKALNALTLAYLKDRKQFGKPIGINQALQHRMVELYMLEHESRAVIEAAYRAVPSGKRAAVFLAAAHVMTLGRQASHEAVQLHGGIGLTEELAVSHYFRRLMVVNRLLGDRALHLREFAVEAATVDGDHPPLHVPDSSDAVAASAASALPEMQGHAK